jgi:multidrug efflux pump subunit AcrA (membrane-fusion protein)
MPGAVAGQGSVYVVDAASGTLARRAVRIDPATLLPGGRVALTQGLKAGDQVVVAGTAFLAEGQRVVVHAPQTVLQEQRP